MDSKEFVKKYFSDAKKSELETKVPALFTLAQCALETGWGEHAPGNMMFGVKDTDGINGNEQLITTTEYLKSDGVKFPVIISKIFNPITKLWKYTVKDYFRKYNTPAESFTDHGKFFIKNTRYKDAFECNGDPYCFADKIAKDGYATGAEYGSQLKLLIMKIENICKQLNLK